MLNDLKRFRMAVDLCFELGYSSEQLTDYLSQKRKLIEFERNTIFLQNHLQDSTRSTKDYAFYFNEPGNVFGKYVITGLGKLLMKKIQTLRYGIIVINFFKRNK